MSLVGWWQLEGNADNKAGSYPSYEVGNVQYSSGKIGQAYDNTGSNGTGIELIRDSPFREYEDRYSFSFWYKSTSTSGGSNERILSRDASEYPTVMVDQSQSGNQNLSIGNATSPGSYQVNEWHHVVFTIETETNTSRVFVDGSLENTGGVSDSGAARPYVIGGNTENDGDISGGHFIGKIDDVRLYDHILSKKEVQRLSQAKVLHYKFNQEDYNSFVPDETGHGYDGTIVRSPVSTTDSALGSRAVDFKSGDNAVTTTPPDFSSPNKLTVSTWAKSNQSAWQTTGTIFARRNQFLIHPSGGNQKVQLYVHTAENGWENVTVSPNDIQAWNHYALTFENGTLTGYLNGINTASTSVGANLESDTDIATIGRDDDGDTNYGNEKIDDARLYAEALSDSEIQALYKNRASIDDNGTFHSHEMSEEVSEGLTVRSESAGNNSGNYSNLIVNGNNLGTYSRGINVLEVDTLGNKINAGAFDVYASPTAETDALVSFIENASPGNILLFSEKDHAGNIQPNGVSEIKELGSVYIDDVADAGRTSWSFIVIKSGAVYGESFAAQYNGPVSSEHTFPDSFDIGKTGTSEAKFNEVGPAPESLVGWWPLDGNVNDYAGTSDGTNNGASVTSGLGQSAYDFERDNNEYIDVGILDSSCAFGTGPFTFSAWVKFESINSNATIFELSRYDDSVLVRPDGSNLEIYIDNGSSDRVFKPNIEANTGKWYHFVVTRKSDGTTVEVFENNNSLGTNNGMNGDMVINQESYIGRSVHSDTQAFDGKIQDVRLYDRSLSAAEVETLYNVTDPREKQRMIQQEDGTAIAKEQFDELL